MGQKVEISRGTLAALVAGLASCLMVLAFLFGRMTAAPPQVSAQSGKTESPPQVALAAIGTPTPETPTRPTSLGQAPPRRYSPSPRFQRPNSATSAVATHQPGSVSPEVRVADNANTEPAPVPSAPVRAPAPRARRPSPASVALSQPTAAPKAGGQPAPKAGGQPAHKSSDSGAIHHYLAQIDSAMAGTASMSDANGFATELLQQSLGGDTSGFDTLIGSTQSTLTKLGAVNPPKRCAEHYKLTVRQLTEGLALLKKVKGATTSLDTGSLSSLSLQGHGMQEDATRLQELDRQLRAEI